MCFYFMYIGKCSREYAHMWRLVLTLTACQCYIKVPKFHTGLFLELILTFHLCDKLCIFLHISLVWLYLDLFIFVHCKKSK